jgi:hypothetical protein
MTKTAKQQWQPIEKLSLLAKIIDGTLASAYETFAALQQGQQNPYSLDDATVKRASKLFTDQKNGLWEFDEQLARWKAQSLTPAQQAEVERLQHQMEKLHEQNTAILSLVEELQELTIERLLEKDDAEVGLEYLLGTLGKPQKKPAAAKPAGTQSNTSSAEKPQPAQNGLCSCAGKNTCENCRFCLKHHTPAGRKALCATIVNFLVFAPIYQHLVSQTLPTVFPNRVVYEDEKDLCSMLFEAVIFEEEYEGETPLAYFLTHASLDEGQKRFYQAWQAHNHYGFFVVEKIVPEKEVHLTDLAGKTTYKVYETRGTLTLKEGTVVIGRLVPFLDGFMFYTESIVSFANAPTQWMKQSAGIPIPQLIFVQRYRQDQELRHNN